MKKLYSILISVLAYTGIHAQQWNWAKSDASNDVYVNSRAASFTGGLIYVSYAHMLMKYDSQGQLLWSRSIDNIHINDVACSSSGDVVIAGSFIVSAVFGSQTLTSMGAEDIFIARFTADGNPVWAQSLGDTGKDIIHSISLDLSDNILVTGEFQGTLVIGNTSLNSGGYHAMLTAKFSLGGTPAWAKQSSGNNGWGKGIKTDSTGNAYILSQFSLPAGFDHTTVTNGGFPYGSNVLVKYSPSGQLLWALFKGDAHYGGMEEISDDKSGYIYTSWDARYETSTIYKYNSNGDELWLNSVGDASYSLPSYAIPCPRECLWCDGIQAPTATGCFTEHPPVI
jgi:hypothetical protein